ncbi:aldo/keto reductase [Halioxenophilus sp. WMMB6]|uniref:aldo/keto reductase n=1 Tax=Halioxenophilus sp. WMMB6 TaxID=3073815 RepID=UPI00295EBD32|nr:aldo/keto reductase [Halioxenophilus sp. WMMB6]
MTFTARTFGKQTVCPIGLGCMSLSWAYGHQPSEAEAAALLEQALALGYDHLDTARLYGDGLSETRIGKTLKSLRKRFYLASKAGIIADGNSRRVDCSPTTLKRACEESLRCLQTDFIDLYYLHRHDYNTPIEQSIGALAELIKEGKIGGIGLSEVSATTLRRAAKVHPITAVQNEYSLWTRNPELGVLAAARELGTTFVAFSPLGRGVLADAVPAPEALPADDFRSNMPRFQPDNWPHNRGLIDQFVAIAHSQGVTPAQLALAWVLAQGEHVVAIPGTSSPAHLAGNIERWQWQPDDTVLQQLDQLINQHTVQGHRYADMMRTNIDTEEFPES